MIILGNETLVYGLQYYIENKSPIFMLSQYNELIYHSYTYYLIVVSCVFSREVLFQYPYL